MRLTAQADRVWTIDGFMSPNGCDEIILASEQVGYAEADVSLPGGARMMKGIRNNERAQIIDPAFAARLWTDLSAHAPAIDGVAAVGLYPRFRFYRYDVGQLFKRHIDGPVEHDGLTSRATFMVYLNDGYVGGETAFDAVTVTPRAGMALIFDHRLKHESVPILSGTKYVLRSDVLYANEAA